VRAEGARPDAEITHARVGGQHQVDRWREPACPAPLVQDLGTEAALMDGVPRECFGERGVEDARAGLIEQAE